MLKLTELSRSIIEKRGISDPEAWVSPQPDQLPHATQFPGLEERAAWWINAIKSSRPILLLGDYDVDGITSCAIAAKFLRSLGLSTEAFIPSRLHDGYGLTVQVLEKFNLDNFGGLLVMDSGTTAHQAMEVVNAAGLPTLVIDHHAPEQTTQEHMNTRIINPRLWGGGFPCSAMLVYQFCSCISPADTSSEMLGLAALAGVADSVPIDYANHTFIKLGLPALEHSKAIRIMGKELDFGLVTRELVSWQIAPRINAAGRMGNAKIALDFLMQPSLAGFQNLEKANQERRALQEDILAQAEAQAGEQHHIGNEILFVHGPWHPGVLGIVASKLVERYQRPAIVVGEADICQGSGRSPAGGDLLGTLRRQTKLDTTWYGGHRAAIGVRIPISRLAEVKALLAETRTISSTSPALSIEAIITTTQVNREEAYALDCLEPFGPEFPIPILGIQGKLEEYNGQIRIRDASGSCPAINPLKLSVGPVIPLQVILTSQGTTARIVRG